MNCQLVLIHGRAQEHKNAADLKQEWLTTFERGLANAGLSLPISHSDIHFPYYGQTLFDLVDGSSEEAAAQVVVRGRTSADTARREFIASVVEEVRQASNIDDASIDAVLARGVKEKGVLQWEWVQAALEAIDLHVPSASGASIALATNDVYQYLRNPGISGVIDSGVRKAIQANVPTVVVAHSLGTVVGYNLLRRDGEELKWKIPLFVTLGSPLAVTAIHQSLRPIRFPSCVTQWFNASDPLDIVALHPLDQERFAVEPAIENMLDVQNATANHHGISGYLDNPKVARRIYDALKAASNA